jgi:hypothetical protein
LAAIGIKDPRPAPPGNGDESGDKPKPPAHFTWGTARISSFHDYNTAKTVFPQKFQIVENLISISTPFNEFYDCGDTAGNTISNPARIID